MAPRAVRHVDPALEVLDLSCELVIDPSMTIRKILSFPHYCILAEYDRNDVWEIATHLYYGAGKRYRVLRTFQSS